MRPFLLSAAVFVPFFGLLVAACDPAGGPAPGSTSVHTGTLSLTAAAASTATSSASATASATSSASAAPTPPPDPKSPFVRHPPHSMNSDADPVDECTQEGGSYFSCRAALTAETDPVRKRYLMRIAQSAAAGQKDYSHKGPASTDLPHAEVPAMCDTSKPCGATNAMGDLNSALSCLASAYAETLANRPGPAKAAHAHACKCDPKEGTLFAYNGTGFLCDAAGKPAFLAPNMKADEAADIWSCAICHPKKGAAACQAEITRLKDKDAELATYLQTKQIPRCQTANEGPNSWSDADK